jgi:hypothetical protein
MAFHTGFVLEIRPRLRDNEREDGLISHDPATPLSEEVSGLKGNTILIEKRFNGPPTTANGGYVCGRLAQFVDGPGAVVRLLSPPPLDTALEVRETDTGVVLLDGDIVLANARPARVTLDAPACPSFEEAQAASRRFRGFTSHWFPCCFVCGTDRFPGDGLGIFAGPLEGSGMVSCPWVPDGRVASPGGSVSPEFVWAALDCPGSFTFIPAPDEAILLGEFQVELFGDISVGERCVLVAWQIAHHGRKHITATALFGESGACRGIGVATFLTVPRTAVKGADVQGASSHHKRML